MLANKLIEGAVEDNELVVLIKEYLQHKKSVVSS